MLRCLATGAAVAGGGVGGLFVPLVVAGALLGRAFGAAVGSTDSLFLVIGIAAFLGAGYRVPLAAVVFVAETTGRPGFVVPGLIAAVVAELVMHRSSVTAYQSRPEPGMAESAPERCQPRSAGIDERERRCRARRSAIDSTIVPMWSKPSPTVLPIRYRAWMPSRMIASLYDASIS